MKETRKPRQTPENNDDISGRTQHQNRKSSCEDQNLKIDTRGADRVECTDQLYIGFRVHFSFTTMVMGMCILQFYRAASMLNGIFEERKEQRRA